MIDARLQYGPFDGIEGHVHHVPVPLALDVKRCHGCGCGRPVHYLVAHLENVVRHGYARYELVAVDDDGALYRHADTLDPAAECTIEETVNA